MHFVKKNPKNYFVLYERVLDTATQEKDLGVIVDDQLKFHEHTTVTVKMANQILGLIKKSYRSRDPCTITTLYKTMIRPHLEYGNAMWGPVFLGDVHKVEKIQRRATKMIYSKNLPYEQRLRTLRIPSLIYRRRKGDMIQMLRIMEGLIRIDHMLLFTMTKMRTREHSKRVYKPQSTKFLRMKSFSQRTINDWNNLPADVIDAPSLNGFKNRLDEHWEGICSTTTVI